MNMQPDPAKPTFSPETISAKRTAINITVIGYVIYGLNLIFNWDIKLSDSNMPIIVPVVGFVMGVGYRLSRFLTNKFPALGWVLFGSGQEPAGIKKIGE